MAIAAAQIITDEMKQVCLKHRVIRLRLFGSNAAGNERPDSDVDLLVDFEANYSPTFFALEALEQDLSPLFNGRTIDLMRPDDVHWFIRRSVLKSAHRLYER